MFRKLLSCNVMINGLMRCIYSAQENNRYKHENRKETEMRGGGLKET